MADETIVQYIVIRKDLQWAKGALVSQGAHASVAAVWNTRTDPTTIAYCEAQDSMHKITVAATSEEELRSVSASLTESKIIHKLWIEQPEGIASCLATAPLPRNVLKPFFQALKLFR